MATYSTTELCSALESAALYNTAMAVLLAAMSVAHIDAAASKARLFLFNLLWVIQWLTQLYMPMPKA